MKIIGLVLGVIWFLVVTIIFIFVWGIDITSESLNSFQSAFFNLTVKNFIVLIIASIPIILIAIKSSNIKPTGKIAIAIIFLMLLGLVSFLISTPTKAKALMKIPLIEDAYDITYNFNNSSIGNASYYIEFYSNDSTENRLEFYNSYFTSHGYQKAPQWTWRGNDEIRYSCNEVDDVGLLVDKSKTRVTGFYKFGDKCLDLL